MMRTFTSYAMLVRLAGNTADHAARHERMTALRRAMRSLPSQAGVDTRRCVDEIFDTTEAILGGMARRRRRAG